MRQVSVLRSSVTIGMLVALWHAIWVILVALGWAGIVLDFVLKLHFIGLRVQILPYSAVTGMILLLVAFTVGAFLGALAAMIWNALVSPGERGRSEQIVEVSR